MKKEMTLDRLERIRDTNKKIEEKRRKENRGKDKKPDQPSVILINTS